MSGTGAPAAAPTARRRIAIRLTDLALGGATRLLRGLGPVGASNLGGAIARTIGPLLPVSKVADDNLRRAMPSLDRRARRRIVRGVWESLGRTFGELPHLGAIEQDTPSGPGFEMIGEEHLLAQAARGGPAIFVSGHIANWEMLPAAVARYGMVMSSMYRAPANPSVDRFMLELRRQALAPHADTDALKLFPKGAKGAKQAVVHLARGGYLGLLVDQKMNDGIEATLFGRKAMTAPAAAALALRFRCPIIPGHVERVGPARFRLICETPLALPEGDGPEQQRALTQAINDHLEGWIRERPESWLWLHRRWPKPDPAE